MACSKQFITHCMRATTCYRPGPAPMYGHCNRLARCRTSSTNYAAPNAASSIGSGQRGRTLAAGSCAITCWRRAAAGRSSSQVRQPITLDFDALSPMHLSTCRMQVMLSPSDRCAISTFRACHRDIHTAAARSAPQAAWRAGRRWSGGGDRRTCTRWRGRARCRWRSAGTTSPMAGGSA